MTIASWIYQSFSRWNHTDMNRLMRILVFFDLPVKTKAEKAAAIKFRNFLLKDGYHMIQLSVYGRICNGLDSVAAHKARLRAALPTRGAVRVLVITEKQYSNIEIFLGTGTVYDEPQHMEQLMIF